MRDDAGSYWLLDFGIARHLDLQSLTASDQLGGPATIGYAPPEQIFNRKREIDARADLFALGVTLYESLHGLHPYLHGARDVRDVMRRMESAPAASLPIHGDAGGEMQRFLTALMQQRRDHRPTTAADALLWARDIQPLIDRTK